MVTGLAAGQHVHERSLASPRRADESREDAGLERAAAASEELQEPDPIYRGRTRTHFLRISRVHGLHACRHLEFKHTDGTVLASSTASDKVWGKVTWPTRLLQLGF